MKDGAHLMKWVAHFPLKKKKVSTNLMYWNVKYYDLITRHVWNFEHRNTKYPKESQKSPKRVLNYIGRRRDFFRETRSNVKYDRKNQQLKDKGKKNPNANNGDSLFKSPKVSKRHKLNTKITVWICKYGGFEVQNINNKLYFRFWTGWLC